VSETPAKVALSHVPHRTSRSIQPRAADASKRVEYRVEDCVDDDSGDVHLTQSSLGETDARRAPDESAKRSMTVASGTSAHGAVSTVRGVPASEPGEMRPWKLS